MKNPFSIEAFADWCETKPAGEEYVWIDTKRCAIAQYVEFIGNPDSYRAIANLPMGDGIRGEDVAYELPHTFGALAKRLRKAQAIMDA